MPDTAVVVTHGFLASVHGKTAHGLIRGSERFTVVGRIDADCAGQDAGQVVEIRVEHDFLPVTPFLPSVTLTSTSSSVIYF